MTSHSIPYLFERKLHLCYSKNNNPITLIYALILPFMFSCCASTLYAKQGSTVLTNVYFLSLSTCVIYSASSEIQLIKEKCNLWWLWPYCLIKNTHEDLGMVAHDHDSSREKIGKEVDSWQCEGVGSCLCGLPHPHEYGILVRPNISCFKNVSKDSQEGGRNLLPSIPAWAKNSFPKSSLDSWDKRESNSHP